MGRPVIESRVLRGGSWNNNQENARADYRNNNRPDDRNNNIGFRVVCSSHIQPSPFESPTGPAGQGWPDAAGGCWMARAGPVRAPESRRRAHSKGAGRRLGQQLRLTPRRLQFILSAGGLADPPTEKTPDFRRHEADVSILPLKREAEKGMRRTNQRFIRKVRPIAPVGLCRVIAQSARTDRCRASAGLSKLIGSGPPANARGFSISFRAAKQVLNRVDAAKAS